MNVKQILKLAKDCGFEVEGFAETVICEQHQLEAFAQAVIKAYVSEQVTVGEALLCNSDDDITTATFNRGLVPIGTQLYTLEINK